MGILSDYFNLLTPNFVPDRYLIEPEREEEEGENISNCNNCMREVGATELIRIKYKGSKSTICVYCKNDADIKLLIDLKQIEL